MSLRDLIISEIQSVAQQQGVTLPELTDDLPLLSSGLDSLAFAILVSRLEDATGADPFSAAEAFEFPSTVGDLIRLYERVHA